MKDHHEVDGGPRHGPRADLYRRLRASLRPGVEPDRIDARRGDPPYERVVEPSSAPDAGNDRRPRTAGPAETGSDGPA